MTLLARGPRSPWRAAAAALLIVAGLVALGGLGYRWARDDSLAILLEFSGQPERDRAGSEEHWRAALAGDRFASGDGARTGAGAVADFRLRNGAHLRLRPASQLRFRAPAGPGSPKLQVDMGQVDVQSNEGAVQLDSDFGELRLDAHSSVQLRRAERGLLVEVEVGRLQLGDDAQALTSGQRLQLEIGGIRLDAAIVERPAAAADAGANRAQPEPSPAVEPPAAPSTPPPELVARAGETFVVHDPDAPLAIGFELDGLCTGPARLASDGQSSEAAAQPSLRFSRGRHRYELRCLDRPGVVVAKGYVSVLPDAGTRQLPAFAPTASVNTDGRLYTVMYQFRLPDVTVSWASAPAAATYTLELDGRTIQTKAPRYELSSLSSGTHLVAFSAASTPARRSRTTTIEVTLDRQAPAARVSSPPLGFEPAASVNVAGQALPGWAVAIGGEPLALDANRNFSTELPGRGVIAIAFTHPSHGTHYYLRRPKAAPP